MLVVVLPAVAGSIYQAGCEAHFGLIELVVR